MKVTFKHKGDLSRTKRFVERVKEAVNRGDFNKYGEMGVQALAEGTPRLSGKTAESWSYIIERDRSSVSIIWTNSNFNDGVSIAVILQYGHGTGTGGYVEGIDYIRPAIRPMFKKIADDAWKEVRNA